VTSPLLSDRRSSLHPGVEAVVGLYLDAVDHEAPGLVEGLYLTGSIALGEFRPGTSDIDFLAILAHHPDQRATAALHRAHVQVRQQCRRPFFDGRYITWTDLARGPAHAASGPYSCQGRFHAHARAACDPVTWHTVARHGVSCRGPEPANLTIWKDHDTLLSWTLENLNTYWRPLLRRASSVLDPWSVTAFTPYGAVWMVLGPCRLHYTLATGQIASKEEAGCYAIQVFPERWHRALNEALRIRRADRARPSTASAFSEIIDDLRLRRAPNGGSLYRTPVSRRRDVLAFADMVIADAKRQWGV
jgi:hypothetical protein